MSSLILASGSPRRRQLLHLAGFVVDAVIPPNIPEVRDSGECPLQYVRRLAIEKSHAVHGDNAWILAADTIVHHGNDIFEKPYDNDDSARMLGALSGTWHQVTTAWSLRWDGALPHASGRRLVRGHRTSRVLFRRLTRIEIERYIQTGEGVDKAGGYAVQGDGAGLIERMTGSTTNIVGLPLDMLIPHMISVGIRRESA